MDPLTHHRAAESPPKSPSSSVLARSTSRPSSPAPGTPVSRGRLGTPYKSSPSALSRTSSPFVSRSSSPFVSAPSSPPLPTAAEFSEAGGFSHPPPLSRLSSSRILSMRSRPPPPDAMAAAASTRKKYTYAAIFLALALVTFVVQTELSSTIQSDLGWNKAYCMMYLTHGSWVLLWPTQLLILRFQDRNVPWPTFWRRHVQLLRTTALMTQTQRLDVSRASVSRAGGLDFALYAFRTIGMITVALTVAGLSWYVAVNMTSPSDLTAIYNCNAFFAYAFSVPILKERLRIDKMVAVGIAIVGVVVVAYGDTDPDDLDARGTALAARRFFGNVIIGIGSILYGLYEVLYKRYACPPDGVSPYRGMLFATTTASCIGAFTLLVMWIPLPILHLTGVEKFGLPTGYTALLVLIAVLANAIFSGSFLVLISLTSPVLSGVASLLTIFLVALADWVLKHKAISGAAIMGGMFIVVAFLMLCWSSYREMAEHAGEEPVDVEYETGSDFETAEAGEDEAALLGEQ